MDYTRKLGQLAIGGRLRRLSERIDEDAARIYAELGVDFEQRWWGPMEYLHEIGPATVGELAASLGISHASVSETRRSLETAQLIEARADPKDGRSRRLSLSRKGRALYVRLAPVWKAMDIVSVEINAEAGNVINALDRLDSALAKASLFERVNRVIQRSGRASRRARSGKPGERPRATADKS